MPPVQARARLYMEHAALSMFSSDYLVLTSFFQAPRRACRYSSTRSASASAFSSVSSCSLISSRAGRIHTAASFSGSTSSSSRQKRPKASQIVLASSPKWRSRSASRRPMNLALIPWIRSLIALRAFSSAGSSSSSSPFLPLGGSPSIPASSQEARLAPAVGYLYLYACGTGVQGVLRELLDHRGGAVDDLSGGYLLCYEGIEYRYLQEE